MSSRFTLHVRAPRPHGAFERAVDMGSPDRADLAEAVVWGLGYVGTRTLKRLAKIVADEADRPAGGAEVESSQERGPAGRRANQ